MSSRASTIDRSVDPSVAKAVESIGSFENLAQHKKGLFRKKVTIHNMLSWTKREEGIEEGEEGIEDGEEGIEEGEEDFEEGEEGIEEGEEGIEEGEEGVYLKL